MINPRIPDNVRILFQTSPLWPSAATVHGFTKGELVVNSYYKESAGHHIIMGFANGANVLKVSMFNDGRNIIERMLSPFADVDTRVLVTSKNIKYALRAIQNKEKDAGYSFDNAMESARSAYTHILSNLALRWTQYNGSFPRIDTSFTQSQMRNVLDVYFGRAQVLDIPATVTHKLQQIDQSFNALRDAITQYEKSTDDMFNKEKWFLIYRKARSAGDKAPTQLMISAFHGKQLQTNCIERGLNGSADRLSSIEWTVPPTMYYGYHDIPADIVDKVMARLTMMRRLRDASFPSQRSFRDPERFFAEAGWQELPSINALTAEPTSNVTVILMDK
jgi:hypothetical protein